MAISRANLTWETSEGIAKAQRTPVPAPVPWPLPTTTPATTGARHPFPASRRRWRRCRDDIALQYPRSARRSEGRAVFRPTSWRNARAEGLCSAEVDGNRPGLKLQQAPRTKALAGPSRPCSWRMFCPKAGAHRIAETAPRSPEAVRGAGRMLVRFSPALWSDLKVIRGFLSRAHVPRARGRRDARAGHAGDRTSSFPPSSRPGAVAEAVAQGCGGGGGCETTLARIVSDYIAGMTDPLRHRHAPAADRAGRGHRPGVERLRPGPPFVVRRHRARRTTPASHQAISAAPQPEASA